METCLLTNVTDALLMGTSDVVGGFNLSLWSLHVPDRASLECFHHQCNYYEERKLYENIETETSHGIKNCTVVHRTYTSHKVK